nr:MAG: internal scaffolding protein [Microvirus sp.]
MAFEIRSAYSKREPVNHPLSGEPSRTKQEFKKEVNINEIVARMRKGIQPLPWMTSATPHYGDFSNLPASFQEAYAIVEQGEAAFASLPLEFRRALDHNPRNLDQAPRELYEQFGLLKAKSDDAALPKEDASPVSDATSKTSNKAQKAVKNADE